MHTALVTGANRGIGLAISQGLAKHGYQVLMGCRQPELVEAGENMQSVQLDLSDSQSLAEQLHALQQAHPQIDILVNNAGVLEHASLLAMEPAAFHHSMQVNCMAAYELIRQLMPSMNQRGFGRIVNLSSGWGSFNEGLEGPAVYAISKAALNGLTVVAAREAQGDVKVNSMCPGWVHTQMGGSEAPRTPEEGADTAIWLATLEADGPNGGFFRDRKPIEW